MSACALCASTTDLRPHTVPLAPEGDDTVTLCATCRAGLDADPLDAHHWHCLQESAWSPDIPVQILAIRLLQRLQAAGEAWANDLHDQLWVEDDVRTRAEAGIQAPSDSPKVVDCNGTELQDGDSVTLIKDLVVKGAGFTAKRGTMVKNIRLGDDPTHVEGKVNKQAIYLKTAFLKRA